MIRRGLNKPNNQLRKVIKLLPECEEWDKDSMDTSTERGKEGMMRDNGDCRDTLCVGREIA